MKKKMKERKQAFVMQLFVNLKSDIHNLVSMQFRISKVHSYAHSLNEEFYLIEIGWKLPGLNQKMGN